MKYATDLQRAQEGTQSATGFSRDELMRRIEMISNDLRGPMNDSERIELCAVRASYRKALAALEHVI